MKRTLKLILSLPLFLSISAQAATVVVLKGGDSSFQRKIFSGYSSAATEKVSAFRYEAGNDQPLLNQIKKLAPDVIFTIGHVPTRKVAEALPSTPLFVSQSMGNLPNGANVLALDDEQPVRNALHLVQGLFPTRKTVGTLYNPKLSQASFDLLVTEGAKVGMRIASLKVDAPSDVKTLINSLSGKVDLIFWIRDGTTSDPMVIKDLYEFAEKNNLPVITSDPSHLESGALLSVAFDPFKLGEKAWEMTKTILKDKKIPKIAINAGNESVVVSLSLKSASQFGLGSDTLYSFFQKTLKESSKIELLP